MKRLIVLISLLLMATAVMGQTDKPQPKVTLRQGGVQQTVMAGDSIEPIVFDYQQFLNYRIDNLPSGLIA